MDHPVDASSDVDMDMDVGGSDAMEIGPVEAQPSSEQQSFNRCEMYSHSIWWMRSPQTVREYAKRWRRQ
jgi:hypothetical protein